MKIPQKIRLCLSRQFPLSMSKGGKLTHFADKIMNGEKIHIIRRNYDLWKLNAERMCNADKHYRLSLRQWCGRPYCDRQVEICLLNVSIGVERIKMVYSKDADLILAEVEGKAIDPILIARNEGLCYDDFKEWFFGTAPQDNKTFEGVIIHLTNHRYTPGV